MYIKVEPVGCLRLEERDIKIRYTLTKNWSNSLKPSSSQLLHAWFLDIPTQNIKEGKNIMN